MVTICRVKSNWERYFKNYGMLDVHDPPLLDFSDLIVPSRNNYLIIGSGMAVHSFASLEEIQRASDEDEKNVLRAKILAESRSFDTHLRSAVTKPNATERKEELLKLESLYEFRRSHPTVEVSHHHKSLTQPSANLNLYQHFTPLLVAAGAAGDAEVQPLGTDVVDAGMSYLNVRFT
jgi:4,5-DOPA dioxygenase extradiol